MNRLRDEGLGFSSSPFFDDFGIGDLIGAHELGDEVAEDADQYHNYRQGNQYPISYCRVQHQIFCHGCKFSSLCESSFPLVLIRRITVL